MSDAYFDVKGESNDEIRNQEESGSEEKEVAKRARDSEFDQPAPSNRGRYYLVPPFIILFLPYCSRPSPPLPSRPRTSLLPDGTCEQYPCGRSAPAWALCWRHSG